MQMTEKKILKTVVVLLMLCIQLNSHAQDVVTKNGKYGLIGRALETLLEPEYDTVFPVIMYGYKISGMYQYALGNKLGIYNYNNKTNTGLELDEITDGQFGTIAFRQGNKWGYAIHTATDYYELTVPKYDEVSRYVSTDNYHGGVASNGINYAGVSVRMGKLYGYSSYFADTLIIPIKYHTYIHHYGGADYLYVQEKNSDQQIIINPETGIDFIIHQHIGLKQHGNYFCDQYVQGTKTLIDVWNFVTGKKVYTYYAVIDNHINQRHIQSDLLEISQAVEDDIWPGEYTLYTWINLNKGTTVLTQQTRYCEHIEIGDHNKLVGQVIYIRNDVCHIKSRKILGRYINGKMVEIED
jgi:hypothetical protein